jgi:1,4-dihydroxy-2-naphthoyl-CoA synthase
MLKTRLAKPYLLQAFRAFSTGEEKHFNWQQLDNGIVMFHMNRPKTRNALSKQLIDEFQDAINTH